MSESPCISGPGHFYHGGQCVICGAVLQCCRSCGYGTMKDNGRISCGHAVDDSAIAEIRAPDGSPLYPLKRQDTNPIWAIRKFSLAGFVDMVQNGGEMTDGMDCDDMSPDDGRTCAVYASKQQESQ